jgi:hypothetical protein
MCGRPACGPAVAASWNSASLSRGYTGWSGVSDGGVDETLEVPSDQGRHAIALKLWLR